MHPTDKYSQLSSIIWPVWLNGGVFVLELSGCGFESSRSHYISRISQILTYPAKYNSREITREIYSGQSISKIVILKIYRPQEKHLENENG